MQYWVMAQPEEGALIRFTLPRFHRSRRIVGGDVEHIRFASPVRYRSGKNSVMEAKDFDVWWQAMVTRAEWIADLARGGGDTAGDHTTRGLNTVQQPREMWRPEEKWVDKEEFLSQVDLAEHYYADW